MTSLKYRVYLLASGDVEVASHLVYLEGPVHPAGICRCIRRAFIPATTQSYITFMLTVGEHSNLFYTIHA